MLLMQTTHAYLKETALVCMCTYGCDGVCVCIRFECELMHLASMVQLVSHHLGFGPAPQAAARYG